MNVLWAGSYTVMKIATGSLHPLAIVFWRMLIAGLILTGWCVFKKYRFAISSRDFIRMCALGILSATSHLLVVIGISYSHAADASLLYVIEPVWGIFLASLVLKERFSPWMGFGLFLILAGVVVLSFDAVVVGNAIIVIGLICEGSFSVAIKPVVDRYPAALIMTVVLWICIAILAIPTFLMTSRMMPTSIGEWGEVFYLAIFCSVIGYLGWIVIMRHVPVNVMYFSIFIQPITGPIIAWMVIGEHIGTSMIAGGTLLVSGMLFAIVSHTYTSRQKILERGDQLIAEATY
jgi:drug/metabolite transporter (DMT)-like permease